MKEIYSIYNKSSYTAQEESPCNGVENITIIVHKKKYNSHKKRKKIKPYQEPAQLVAVLSRSTIPPKRIKLQKHSSLPTVNRKKKIKLKVRSSDIFPTKNKHPYRSDFIVNTMSERRTSNCMNAFKNPLTQPQWRIYRCQLNAKEESCCCSCNSDAMFEVMKSLYDCYKKKNCDNCNCILCGHLPREERRLGELRKVSGRPSSIAVATVAEKERRKAEVKRLEKEIEGKPPEEKQKILEQAAMSGAPLPEGKSPSEKEMIKTIRTKLGLPQEPKSAADRERMRQAEAAGLIVPLEGKTPAEKEKILRTQAELGIPLPEGRTPSEKALIDKIKTSLPSVTAVHPSKLKKAKEAGFLTPLEGKAPEQKERILKGLAQHGIPLPEGKTASEKKLIEKVRRDVGLPPEPKTPSMKEKHRKAAAAGLLEPLEGKTAAQKEKILTGQAQLGLPLPEGRTPSEKALIEKIKATVKPAPSIPTVGVPSEKLRKAKAAGFLTPLEGKTPAQKEKILKGLAKHGIPLPEGKTASEKKLIDKVRKDMGIPPEPKTRSMKEKHRMAAAAGILTPLEGKSAAQKEKILTAQAELGLPLPEGRTPSEKAIIDKIKATVKPQPSIMVPSEKIRKARAAGLLTPLSGKSPEQKEKILKGLAGHGIPLPEGKTASEKKLIEKVRADMGLPPEPKTPTAKENYKKAIAAGFITPLEGKTQAQKEKILKGQAEMGLPLPEGRTPSEKALIAKVKATTKPPSEILPVAERLKKARAAGLLTPLTGKTPTQKENIIKGLAMQGLPLPEAKTPSEKKIVEKLRADLGLPPEPKTPAEKDRYDKAQAAGLIVPLEGKSPAQKEKILTDIANMGLPLPEGRTPSEKALVSKVKAARRGPPLAGVPSERLKKAKAAGLITPLEGKTPEQREDIIKGLAMHGIPLPEAQTASEKKLIDKVRGELGLPPEPKTAAEKEKYAKAMAAGVILPLEGKSPAEKEKILNDMADMGLSLPEGRTPSEKAIVAKVKAAPRHPMVHSEKLRKARAAGLMTPLEGKSPAQKEKILKGLAMHGIPLPEGKTSSEKKLVDQVRKDLGLPPEPKTAAEKENYARGVAAGIIVPLEGKTAAQKKKILSDMADAGIPLPEGRTPSEKALVAKVKAAPRAPPIPSERLKKAKAAGLLTPLEGKSPAQKEKILKGLAMHGIPLPEGHTSSDKKLVEKVRGELGLPPEPKTSEERVNFAKAMAAGVIVPLEGKTPAEKEKILTDMADMGVPLPEGRTASEKALVAKVKAAPRAPRIPSEKLKKAKAAGLLTPLEGKSPAQKEKIIKGLAMHGIPLPEGKTASEKKLINKVRGQLGLPPEPKTPSEKEKFAKAHAAGLIVPLEGKSPAEKEKILRGMADMGIPLPVGRTPSEKALVARVKAAPRALSILGPPSERLRKAKAAGLVTPLEGKTPEQKEKIVKGLAMHGVPLPEAKTPSEKKMFEKLRTDLGLPPEPKTPEDKENYARAQAAGLIVPLEGKTPAQKEKILKGMVHMGVPLPAGRTPSEKSLIARVKAAARAPSLAGVPSEKLRKARAAGLLTPLEGKTPDQKEKILKGLAMHGVPLPTAKTPAEKKIMDKVRADLGLPPTPKTAADKERYGKAAAAGILVPLEGKTPQEKEKILRAQAEMGIPLPEGRTPSEKAMIQTIKATVPKRKSIRPVLPPDEAKKLEEKTAKVITEGEGPSDECICDILTPESERRVSRPPVRITSEKLRAAKAAGLLTPLEGKTPEQKEKIMKGLAKHGLPLPEGKTASEKKLVEKVRADLGLPPEPKTATLKDRYAKAQATGLITPLEGKSHAQKEKILRGQAELGLPLPEGRTPSEKALINKVRATVGLPPSAITIPSEKLRKARAAGLLTPLEGKTPQQKERILKGRVAAGLPLPEGITASDKKLIKKVKAETGYITPIGKTPSEKEILKKAQAAGLLTPLEGKSKAQKKKIIQERIAAGLPIPEGATPSDKDMIKKLVAAAPPPSLEGKSPAEKEKILRSLARQGRSLPEGKTPSEKAIIQKVRADIGLRPPYSGLPSEKIRKAKAAGLLTPLEGKTPAQKEKILKGLAKAGIPLPEGKTDSEKKLIHKVRDEVGLPPEPKTPSMREKHRQAYADGIMTPLEGKPPAEKEKILKRMHDAGITLPEGKTPSEKELVRKVRAMPRAPSMRIPSAKLKAAKAAGLLTPIEGKPPAEKERIIRGLAESGLPLPEGKTKSEKSMIKKIKTEYGIPAAPTTPSEQEVLQKAKAAGLLTPLSGKTPAEKERILKGLADAGLPLPMGKTPSEKALVKKVREASGLPAEPTPSEKAGKIRKLKKVRPAGITEELEEITKTTVCEKACGCDKKKIRFKHSYVKIRVTSPDISSLCPCPDECVPGVKHGVFTDNEGIKVTVGSALGVPLYLQETPSKIPNSLYFNQRYHSSNSIDSFISSSKEEQDKAPKLHKEIKSIFHSPVYSNNSTESVQHKPKNLYNDKSKSCIYDYTYQLKSKLLDEHAKNNWNTSETINSFRSVESSSSDSNICLKTTESSFDSILIIKTESSLSLSSSVDDIATISVISIDETSNPSRCSHYLCYSQSDTNYSNDSFEESEYLRKLVEYSKELETSNRNIYKHTGRTGHRKLSDIVIFRMSHSNVKASDKDSHKKAESHKDPIVVISYLNSDQDVTGLVDEIISQKLVSDTSSIFVVVPTTDKDPAETRFSSTICIEMSEYAHKWNNGVIIRDVYQPNNRITTQGFKISSKGKRHTIRENSQDKVCQAKLKRKVNCRVASMDTTSDRPCCCPVNGDESSRLRTELHCVASVVSEVITPLIAKQGVAQGLSHEAYANAPRMNLSIKPSRRVPRDPTPVRHCIVPSCSGHNTCHDVSRFGRKAAPPTYHNQSCGPEEPNVSHDKRGFCLVSPPTPKIRTQPAACGLDSLPVITPRIRPSWGTCGTCGSCGQPTMVKGKLVNCPCKGNEKKPKILLPRDCGEPTPPCVTDTIEDTKSVSCQCCFCEEEPVTCPPPPCEAPKPIIKCPIPMSCEEPKPIVITCPPPPPPCAEPKPIAICPPPTPCGEPKSIIKCKKSIPCGGKKQTITFQPPIPLPESPRKPCLCSDKKKRKKVICECPQVEELPPEEEEIPEPEPPSEREILKMKSDLTQTTSGFKLHKKGKPPPEEQLSFEEALSYYKAFAELETLDKESCTCDDSPPPKKEVECECPEQIEYYEPSLSLHETIAEEQLKGLKFAIGGKGSGSKGLDGICCFDMIQQDSANHNFSKLFITTPSIEVTQN
ncbi:titin [Manduca sexta]|uniref:titin n=1 Tax=Manduca sexta TaxID=7130 RepID=UPI00188FEBAD|nr:titin [Manduca sexta]